MGDLNGDLGSSLGDKGTKELNDRGLLLCDFADFFNLNPVNLLSTCNGRLESYFSHCGRYRSTIDYILLPSCFESKIIESKTFELDFDNTSDHQPLFLESEYPKEKLSNKQPTSSSAFKHKIRWSSLLQETIHNKYVIPLQSSISIFNVDEFCDFDSFADVVNKLLSSTSSSLVFSRSSCPKKRKHGIYVSLLVSVKEARIQCMEAFESWKQVDFLRGGMSRILIQTDKSSKRMIYRSAMRDFLNETANTRVQKLSFAADNYEKTFWRLLKGQRCSSQMRAFLVNGELITDKNKIRNMWADHFEALGTLSSNTNYDNNFFDKVTTSVKEIFESSIRDPFGVLSEPLTYKEVVKVCSNLKFEVSSVYVDYEHIRYGGPPLWQLMFELYREFFEQSSASKSLKTGLILPLFKGKGAKANNKDNYRGITLFPMLCKIYEMILLNRVETYATEKGYFSKLQFGFREGVGCIEASFIILETINHMLERGSKVFSCFLDVRKAFDTVWIDGLLYKLFIDLGINGKM